MPTPSVLVLAFAFAGLAVTAAGAQNGPPRNDLPQPYTTTRTWGELPPGVKWAAVTAIEPAADGAIYVVHRCFENSCAGRSEAPILKYNAAGQLLASFGQGLLIFPHGGTVDRQGNLWMTDAGSAPGQGHQAIKFSPDGKILMTLGKAGVSGSGSSLFDQPTDVVVAPNGDLFITDSHRNGKNNRVMHFTEDGKFVKEWGRKGSGRGELSEPHTIAMDSRGRLFVGDRENNRIVIYSQDGQVLDEWRQFGRPSGIVITSDDTIYVADSESWGTDTGAHELPGIKKGIRIGSARDGRVTAFIEDQESTAADHAGAEGLGVDAAGNVYGGVVRRRMLERHVRNTAPDADWTQWRGPGRDGVVPQFTAPSKWPEQLTRRWQVEVGTGHATPLIVGGRVFMFSRRGEDEVLAAFDAVAGKELWAAGYPAPYTPNRLAIDHGQGPKSTPLFVDGRIFTLGISGILSAFDAGTGKRLWHKPAPPAAPTYSTSQSPLFDNGQLIVHLGGYGKGALTSLNPATGSINWEWTGDGPAYGSPIVAEFGGTRQVITFTENMLVGVSAASGELLWSRPFHSARDVQAITPLVYRDTIIVTAFESGITAIRIAKRDGKWGTDNAWKNDEQYSRFSNAVIVGDAYFALSGKSGGMFMYLDARTGTLLWKGEPRSAENAAIARAGNVLFALKDDGELIVADGSNPTAFNLIRRYQVSDSATWAAPSISGNRLFVKGLSTLTLWTID